jgi:hypothetical protein
MEIDLRPISHSSYEVAMGHCIFYPPIKTDAISCTFNTNGFTPMLAVLRSHCFDTEYFFRNSVLGKWHSSEFRVHVHQQYSPLLLTTTKMSTWDDAPQASSEIIKVADAEGCESLCLSHFMFLQGKFPKSALKQCLQMAASTDQLGALKRVIVDVDVRHIDAAKKLLDAVCARQAYAHRHSLLQSHNVYMAEAGSPDFQSWLAAEILCRSSRDDRCVEALKWMLLAYQSRWSESPDPKERTIRRSTYEFLASGMSSAQVDSAFDSAAQWLKERLVDPIDLMDFVPEFRNYIAALSGLDASKE